MKQTVNWHDSWEAQRCKWPIEAQRCLGPSRTTSYLSWWQKTLLLLTVRMRCCRQERLEIWEFYYFELIANSVQIVFTWVAKLRQQKPTKVVFKFLRKLQNHFVVVDAVRHSFLQWQTFTAFSWSVELLMWYKVLIDFFFLNHQLLLPFSEKYLKISVRLKK